jgi:hypothetical protein
MLPELIVLAGGAGHVVTVADFGGAQEHPQPPRRCP